MLETANLMATVAVRNLEKARAFYEGTLGLKPESSMTGEAVTYKTSGAPLVVYRSEFAGGNRATAATWALGKDFEGTVRALASKGITFEHYDMKGMERMGDIHAAGDMRMAWFKDPDGNIHGLINR